jgi:DHA1 family multidrug resistance protein-like MFS transporter
MEKLGRILSRPTAKPYRTRDLISHDQIYVNAEGQVDFSSDDVENPHNWSTARRWYVTCAAVLLVVNATFASSSPSGCFEVGSLGSGKGAVVVSNPADADMFLTEYC